MTGIEYSTNTWVKASINIIDNKLRSIIYDTNYLRAATKIIKACLTYIWSDIS